MTLTILLHTIAAIVAILSGLAIVLLPKGTLRHRKIGRIYVASIGTMLILSIFIQEINPGSFSIFHLITIQAALFVAAGLAFLALRRSVTYWYAWHLRFMLYSYVTLIVTGIAQALEYLPFGSAALNAVIFIQLPALIGWYLIEFRGVPRWRQQFEPGVSQSISVT